MELKVIKPIDPAIHPTAIINPTAIIHKNVTIGPYVVIGPRCEIGCFLLRGSGLDGLAYW